MDKNKKNLHPSYTKNIWIIYAVIWVMLCVGTEIFYPSHKGTITTYFLEFLYIGAGIGCIALQYIFGYLHFTTIYKSFEGFANTDKQMKGITIFTCTAVLIGCYVPLVYFANIDNFDNSSEVYATIAFVIFAIESYVTRKNIGLRLITYFLYILAFAVPTPFLYVGYTWLKDGFGYFNG